ncbi:MAG: hypothetical protein JXR70_07395 [Spirochaetales bacterium]|nr:hypothetical protein [Spirochaetales bacterium]
MKKICFLLFIFMLAGACSTIPVINPQKDMEFILSAFNEKQTDFLITQTAIPFLIDSEIILQKSDIVYYWESMVQIGPLEGYKIGPLTKLNTEDSYLYSDSLEVKLFFQKYLPKQAYLAVIESYQGMFHMIIAYDKNNMPHIFGIRGPEHE